MVDIPTLIRRVDKHAARTGRTVGGISKYIFDDVRTVDQLRNGSRAITLRRLDRASEKMSELERKAVDA